VGDKTHIQWTGPNGHTWNPWQGCDKVSPACDFCYMYRDKKRYGQDPEAVVRSATRTFNAPLRWQREAKAAGRVDLVFTCSWSDWFHKDADAWRDDAWAIIRQCPNLIFMVLTKRVNLIETRLPKDWGKGYDNVWLGVSVETQAWAQKRIPKLALIPAKVRFLSVEPQLGPITLFGEDADDGKGPAGRYVSVLKDSLEMGQYYDDEARPDVDWVIVGGESGGPDESRPFDPEWAKDIVGECDNAGVAVFVKQMGSWWARYHHAKDDAGGDPAEWPEVLRRREWPAGYLGDPRLLTTKPDPTLVPWS